MPGSRRPVAYFTDDGTEMYVMQDESVAESNALGFGVAITPSVAADPCRRLSATSKFPIEPRYVRAEYTNAAGNTVKRRFFVGTTSAPAWSGSPYGVIIDGQEYNITARVGEVRHYIAESDTGLTDGDVDSNLTAAV